MRPQHSVRTDNTAAMRLIALLSALLFPGCTAFRQEPVTHLRGHLVLAVEPNPIVAVAVSENLYDLKFDIIMREDGGVGVTIENFTVDAIAFHTVTVQSQSFPATFITDRGYPAHIDAGKYLRFSFTKRWPLPTHLLLSGSSARVTARTVDDHGVRAETVVRVKVVVGADSSS